MAIDFSIDNNRLVDGIQDLTLDESPDDQTTVDANGTATSDPDDDVDVSYDDDTNQLTGGLDDEFLTFLEGLFAADADEDAALGYVDTIEAASSSDTFIRVTATAGETIESLFFSINPSAPTGLIPDMTTLDGDPLYFHIAADNHFATVTTDEDPGEGRIVAAFYLDEVDTDPDDNVVEAQVQMVTFEPILHPDETDHDDFLDFTDVLQVSVAASTNFVFENLPSGNFLYAAFGDQSAALVVTGDNLSVQNNSGQPDKIGEVIKNDSDTVNTSQAAPGELATIGIESQHFVAGGQGQNLTDGSIANFTFVTGFIPLLNVDNPGDPATGTNALDLDYSNYVNTNGAGLEISQLTGGTAHADLRISLWEAGDDDDSDATPLVTEEELEFIDNGEDGIGDGDDPVDDDTALHDDNPINVGTVTVLHNGQTLVWDSSNWGENQDGVIVDIEDGADDTDPDDGFSHSFTVTGLDSFDIVDWTADGGDTFNRVKIQALSTTDPFDLGGVHITQGTTVSAGLGSHLLVEDDGPSIERNEETVPTLTTDDTDIEDTDGPTSFAGLFDEDFGTDGPKDEDDDDVEDEDATTYALGVSAPDGVDSGLVDTLTGDKIYLFLESGEVVGRVGLDDDGGADDAGAVAFTISVDANSGDVTQVQSRSVVHDDSGDPVEDGSSAAGLLSADLVTLTATIEDGDGDTDSDTADIGDAFKFEDDGPSITRNEETVPTLVTDDTDIEDTDGPTSFAGLFDEDFGEDDFKDADDDDVEDEDATTYALGVSAPDGVDSGLVDTLTGDKIYLFLESGEVVGRVGLDDDGGADDAGAVAFTISVDANSGDVTQVQSRSVVHDDSGDPVEDGSSAAGLLSADLVTLTATIEDGDGDTDSDTADIGDAFKFEDDGPSITRNEETVPTLVTDDTDIEDTDGPTSFAGLFDEDFGEDDFKDADDDDVEDEDATTYALGVSAPDGVDSGLVDTLTGDKIYLFLESGEVVGRVGLDDDGGADDAGAVAFTISVDANSGDVTQVQSRSVVHDDSGDPVEDGSSAAGLLSADLVTLTATIEDGDGDTDSDTADIGDAFKFEDDGPSIERNEETVPTLTTDDTDIEDTDGPTSFAGLFDEDFGEDGFKDADDDDAEDEDATTYALGVSAPDGVDSGLVDTLTGDKIYLFLESGEVVGRVGLDDDGGADDAGAVAFTISVDANSGDVTQVQSRSVVHDDSGDPVEDGSSAAGLLSADLVTLTATIEDGDGDTDSDTADIGDAFKFEDDGPSIERNEETVPTLVTDDTDIEDTDGPTSFAGLFDEDFGEDGFKDADDDDAEDEDATTYALGVSAPDGVDSGLVDTLTGDKIYLFLESGEVVGRVGLDDDGGADDAGAVAFTISVDANSGDVTQVQSRSVVHDDSGDPVEDGSSAAGLLSADLVTLTATIEDGDGDTDSDTADIGDAFKFEDDGPSIERNEETVPTLTTDDTDTPDATDGPEDFSILFDEDFGKDDFKDADDDDVEDDDATTYELSITGGDGTDSLLDDTLTGDSILLRLTGSGDIEGYLENDDTIVAFTIDLDPLTGEISLEQDRAILHDNPNDPEETGTEAEKMAAGLIVLTATIEDGDGDTDSDEADIGDAFRFLDDGPTADLDEVTDNVDGDGGAGGNAGGPGDDPTSTRVATGNVAPIFDAGKDGLQGYSMSLITDDLPDDLTSQGGAIVYDVDGNLLTAYVEDGTTPGDYQEGEDRAVFTFELDGATGDYTFTQLDQLDHAPVDDNGDPVDSFENDLEIQLGILLEVTDGDGDGATASLDKMVIIADDDSPVVNTDDDESNDAEAFNEDIVSPGATGAFSYDIGFDDRDDYDEDNTDLLVDFVGGTVGEGANANPITEMDIDWFSEDDSQVTFTFTFEYVSDPSNGTTTPNGGTLTFYKNDGIGTDDGTYNFKLTSPIVAFGILSLANAQGFQGYLPNSATTDNSQPLVTVAALADDFFVQFTGREETGGGSDGKNATQQNSEGNNKNLDALDPDTDPDTPGLQPEPWSNGDDDAFADGELFTQSQTWVSISGTAAGTAGDTMQAGEVLDFNFYAEDPQGFLTSPGLDDIDTATTSTMFIEFDALDNGEDLVVVLKLVDKDDPDLTTTRAVIVDFDDIFHIAQAAEIPDGFIVPGSLDQNDGLVIIESNDYNILDEDNWTIAGAQVVASTEGLTGSGINLNRAIGALGGSTFNGPDNVFTTTKDSGGNNGGTWDGDVFKIVNIGFLTEITPDSEFNFDVNVVDFDGDVSATQHLTITVLGDADALII